MKPERTGKGHITHMPHWYMRKEDKGNMECRCGQITTWIQPCKWKNHHSTPSGATAEYYIHSNICTHNSSKWNWNSLYAELHETIDSIPEKDVLVLTGGFNAKVGSRSTMQWWISRTQAKIIVFKLSWNWRKPSYQKFINTRWTMARYNEVVIKTAETYLQKCKSKKLPWGSDDVFSQKKKKKKINEEGLEKGENKASMTQH